MIYIWKEQLQTIRNKLDINIKDVPEESGDDCNRQLKAYVDKVKSKINIDVDNEGINYHASARTTENKYEPIPEPVACAALKLIKEYDFSDVENEQWLHIDNDGKEVKRSFFDPDLSWAVCVTNYSRGGTGRIRYGIEGRKYILLEFWIRNNRAPHFHEYPVQIKIKMTPKQPSQAGGIPRSKAIGDFEFMKKYADWRK